MIDIIGWMGATLFAICGIPQLYKSLINTSSVKGLSLSFILMWFFGEIFTLIYAIFRVPKLPLLVNYVFNLMIITSIVLIYMIYRNKEDQNLIIGIQNACYKNVLLVENISLLGVVGIMAY